MRKNTIWTSKYFCGNEISAYGLEHNHVDYATLSKAFDSVLNNNIISVTGWENWEQENGYIDNSEEIDELREQIEALEDEITEETTTEQDDITCEKIREIEERIEELEAEQDEQPEIYQYYIISRYGAKILEDYTDEIIFYNSDLDMYVWGVTHWGTSWDYVLTDIKIDLSDRGVA